jgi:radical SAM superfamily enzyme YgiQ (UPF0313 family)
MVFLIKMKKTAKKIKIIIGYPPTLSEKGIALLSQNRQFQWFSNPTYLFPVILASAATVLKKDGNDVLWLDSIAEKISEEEFFSILKRENPDLFIFETKTPVIKQHWKIINKIKDIFPKIKIAILGDHVTAFPIETIKNSKVDFVLTGGDFDFSSLNLVRHLSNGNKLEPGVYYRKDKKIISTGKFQLNHNLDELPFIDRELTKWRLYEKEYNLIGNPYMYIMSGRDCWWGKCKFCAWPVLYPRFRVRSVNNVLDEIGILIEKYNVKEIFDDSGTLCTGKWIHDLCNGLIKRGYNKKIKFSCNMRFNALKQEEYNLMKKANFRLLKFGLESANQSTLEKLNKGIKVQNIIDGCRMAKKAGLTVHLTMIVGYPWETKKDAENTFNLAKYLMQSGKADVLQSTVLVAYPGTPLWKEAKDNNWFTINYQDYDKYDMSRPILKTKNSNPEEVAEICHKIYKIFLTPKYIFARLRNVKSFDDLKFNLRGIGAVLGHLKDFGKKQ